MRLPSHASYSHMYGDCMPAPVDWGLRYERPAQDWPVGQVPASADGSQIRAHFPELVQACPVGQRTWKQGSKPQLAAPIKIVASQIHLIGILRRSGDTQYCLDSLTESSRLQRTASSAFPWSKSNGGDSSTCCSAVSSASPVMISSPPKPNARTPPAESRKCSGERRGSVRQPRRSLPRDCHCRYGWFRSMICTP